MNGGLVAVCTLTCCPLPPPCQDLPGCDAVASAASLPPRRHRPMATLTSLLTSSPLHVLLVEVLTRYLKNYGARPRLKPRPLACVCVG